MDSILLVFQKNPELGKVKTRLAATVGDVKAIEIYLQLISHTKRVIDTISVEKQIWYSSWVEHNDEWNLKSYSKFTQKGSDLGNRMSFAFENAFKDWDVNKVIIIGTDCVEISTSIIQDAFESLDSNDFVIGPAYDGGYYLFGMNTFHHEVFEQIKWSSDTVYDSTLKRINTLGKNVFVLPKLNDVDTFDDWEKVKEQISI